MTASVVSTSVLRRFHWRELGERISRGVECVADHRTGDTGSDLS